MIRTFFHSNVDEFPMIEAGDLNSGDVIDIEDTYYQVKKTQHVKKSRGQAYIQTELKNLDQGGVINRRFRSDEKVDRIHTEEKPMQFTYESNGRYHFMDLESAEEVVFNEEEIKGIQEYLLPNTEVRVVMFEGNPVEVKLPRTVELEVVETPPQMQGATATDKYKPATLETGLETRVPPFIEEGEVIAVDTDDASYVERAS